MNLNIKAIYAIAINHLYLKHFMSGKIPTLLLKIQKERKEIRKYIT